MTFHFLSRYTIGSLCRSSSSNNNGDDNNKKNNKKNDKTNAAITATITSTTTNNNNNNNDTVSDSNHISNSGSNNSKPNLASVFQRFNDLQKSIDDKRQQQKDVKDHIEEIHRAMRQSKQERSKMELEMESCRKEAQQLVQQVDRGNEELWKIQADETKARVERQRAQQELDGIKLFVEEQRRQFLEQSRDFRRSVKRTRLRASMLGLEYAPLKAFATVMAAEKDKSATATTTTTTTTTTEIVDPSAFEESNEGVVQPALELVGGNWTVADEASNSIDPNRWKADERDDEMKTSLDMYHEERTSLTKVQQTLEHLQTIHKKAEQEAVSRLQRKEQLFAQMQRIEKDILDMEQELNRLEQDTQESSELGQGFERDVKVKRHEIAQRRFENGGYASGFNSQSRGRTPKGGNPYAKKARSQSVPTPIQNGETVRHSIPGSQAAMNVRNRSAALASKSVTPTPHHRRSGHNNNNSNNMATQHPHRAGRKPRKDRQFASSISIFDDNGGNSGTHQHKGKEAGTSGSNAGHCTINKLVGSDSSDDDDDLLTFTPFAKKK